MLVFEDDIKIVDITKFKNQVQDNIKELNEKNVNWDVFSILNLQVRDSTNLVVQEDFSPLLNNSTIFTYNNCNEKYCKVNSFFGTQCYIIKKI